MGKILSFALILFSIIIGAASAAGGDDRPRFKDRTGGGITEVGQPQTVPTSRYWPIALPSSAKLAQWEVIIKKAMASVGHQDTFMVEATEYDFNRLGESKFKESIRKKVASLGYEITEIEAQKVEFKQFPVVKWLIAFTLKEKN